MHMCMCALPPSWTFDNTSRRSWKCTYTHVHCLCDCVTVWHNAGVSFPSWGCLTQAHALWPCSAASSCSFYTFPAVFSLTRVYNWAICAKPDSCTFSSYIVQKIPHTLTLLLYTCVIWVLGLCHYVFLCHLSFVFVKILLYVSKSPLASTIHHSWMKKATLKISQLKTFPIDWDVEMNAERDKETHIEG